MMASVCGTIEPMVCLLLIQCNLVCVNAFPYLVSARASLVPSPLLSSTRKRCTQNIALGRHTRSALVVMCLPKFERPNAICVMVANLDNQSL